MQVQKHQVKQRAGDNPPLADIAHHQRPAAFEDRAERRARRAGLEGASGIVGIGAAPAVDMNHAERRQHPQPAEEDNRRNIAADKHMRRRP